MNQMHIRKSISMMMVLILFIITGRWPEPAKIPPGPLPITPDSLTIPSIHVRKLETPIYTWKRGAIIFTMDRVGDSNLKGVADKIIRAVSYTHLTLPTIYSV